MGLSHEDMRAMANGIAGPLHEHVQKALSPLLERIAVLEARLAEIEKAGVRFRGVHQRAATYKRGDQVTFKGCLWACVVDETDAMPGDGPAWQLAAKGTK